MVPRASTTGARGDGALSEGLALDGEGRGLLKTSAMDGSRTPETRTRTMTSRALLCLTSVGFGLVGFGSWTTQAQAAPIVQGRPADAPLSVEDPRPSSAVSRGEEELAEGTGVGAPPSATDPGGAGRGEEKLAEGTGGGAPAGASTELPEGPPPPRLDPRAVPIQVAVGLGPSAPGSREELALVDALEASAAGSSSPLTSVRRLHGAGEPRSVCRQRRDDLVLTLAYVAEWEEPVILTYDCALERPLGARAATAAGERGLVGALWSEHEELLRRGVKERRAPLLSRRARRIVIAGGAAVVLGVALGVILASTLRPSTVVLTVGQ